MKKIICAVGLLCGALTAAAQLQTNAGVQYLQCMPKDMSGDFNDLSNTYFLADSLATFDAAKGEGLVNWKRYCRLVRLSISTAIGLFVCRCSTSLMLPTTTIPTCS